MFVRMTINICLKTESTAMLLAFWVLPYFLCLCIFSPLFLFAFFRGLCLSFVDVFFEFFFS